MLNYIWLALILLAVLIGGFDNKLKEVADGAVKGAESAVTPSLGVFGVVAVLVGLMGPGAKAGPGPAPARFFPPAAPRPFSPAAGGGPATGGLVVYIVP